jgi:hypothetical protein
VLGWEGNIVSPQRINGVLLKNHFREVKGRRREGKVKRMENLKDFSFDCAEVEAAVISDKRDGLIELLLKKTSVIRHNSDADKGGSLTVVEIDLGDRDIIAAFQSFNDAFDDVAFILEAVYAEQV